MSNAKALLRKLDDALIGRRTQEGFRFLEEASEEIERLTPQDPDAIQYLLTIAQWVDLGYRDHRLLADLLKRFSSVIRSELKLADFIQLRLAEAFLAFACQDLCTAVSILESVLAVQLGISDPRLILLVHFWKGRVHRRKGEYELAVHHILEAKTLAQQLKAPKLIAVIEIHESWLVFQRGQRKEALRLLADAEKELKSTGHELSLGNIESARGRFVRRSGQYAKALEHFRRAITIYSKHFPNHPNLARTLVNSAYVKRLIALDLAHKAKDGRARGGQHNQYLKICQEALAQLESAREIYALHGHHGGMGAVLVNTGHLHLDSGDIDRALQEATNAFQLGNERKDHILMARARILQAAIENLQADEEIGEAEDIATHANLAKQHSDEAIELAQHTQNRRLLAAAYIARGATAANVFFEDWETAKHLAAQASDLLDKDDRDHLSQDLHALKAQILRATGIDQTLRSWSDGLTGGKTFQQVTEEFAEIVIPKVWIREGRKVSRVAEKLAISPKKVRRILRNVQLLK